MAIITDTSFFVQDKMLPETDVNKPYGENLKDRIASLEPAFLIETLGYETYKTLDINTEATSGIWYELLNGKEFTDKLGRGNYWYGLRSIQWSPIAYYVYYNVIRETNSTVTKLGVTQASHENSLPVAPSQKLCDAWNKMVDSLWIMDDFLRQNAASYTTYIGLQYVPFVITNVHDLGYSNNKYYQKINELGI